MRRLVMTNKQGLFLQPTYFPLVEYGKQRGNIALEAFVSSPTYKLQNRPEVKYLDVSASFNAKDRSLHVNVLNRSKDKDIATRVESQEGQLESAGEVWEMNHSDLKATHTFGADQKVRPVTRALAANWRTTASPTTSRHTH